MGPSPIFLPRPTEFFVTCTYCLKLKQNQTGFINVIINGLKSKILCFGVHVTKYIGTRFYLLSAFDQKVRANCKFLTNVAETFYISHIVLPSLFW